jgi:hypothetical protein
MPFLTLNFQISGMTPEYAKFRRCGPSPAVLSHAARHFMLGRSGRYASVRIASASLIDAVGLMNGSRNTARK